MRENEWGHVHEMWRIRRVTGQERTGNRHAMRKGQLVDMDGKWMEMGDEEGWVRKGSQEEIGSGMGRNGMVGREGRGSNWV